jgi:hypothetical protein
MNALREYLSKPDRTTDLIERLVAAEKTVDEIRRALDERVPSDWATGCAEGAAIEAADTAWRQLMGLRHILALRLDWPEPKEEEPDAAE